MHPSTTHTKKINFRKCTPFNIDEEQLHYTLTVLVLGPSSHLLPQWINNTLANGAVGVRGRVIGDAVPLDLWITNYCCEPFINRFGKVQL
jgi:hypothetical protein